MFATPATLEDACKRCHGTGFVDSPRAHLSVPGLCFDCDGDGTRATQLANRKTRREAAAAQRRFAEISAPIMAKIWATKQAHDVDFGYQQRLERQRAIVDMGDFTTQHYADRFGVTKERAWIELCCMYPRVDVKWTEDMKPLWTAVWS